MKTSYNVPGFKERLEQAIFDSGMTFSEVARRAGIKRSLIWSYRFGGAMPSVYVLMRLAKALNVSTDWLLGLVAGRGNE